MKHFLCMALKEFNFCKSAYDCIIANAGNKLSSATHKHIKRMPQTSVLPILNLILYGKYIGGFIFNMDFSIECIRQINFYTSREKVLF